MPFPRKTIPISLTAATPSTLTVEALKKQLTDIGLTCPDSHVDKLEKYIREVKAEMPGGEVETFAILRPAKEGEATIQGLMTSLTEASTGNWEPDGTGFGYAPTLEYIQYEPHFDWLKRSVPGFTGISKNPSVYTGRHDTIDAVKRMFLSVATDASSALVKGLNKASLESVLSNAIAPLNDSSAKNYNPGPDSRVIFLVDNYNPEKQEANGIGFLSLWWDLKIDDYKEKKGSPQHDVRLEVRCRSVLYSSIEAMKSDELAVQTEFKQSAFASLEGIPSRATITIFTTRPPADAETFRQSLPKVATEKELQVLVLYAPNLQNVGSIDNTNSNTTTDYTKSVTRGFTFSTTQQLSVEASFEASAEVVKVGLKVGFSISFTEQWSTTTTETMRFSVPPGKKAFNYQGYMMAQILSYDPKTATFAYKSVGRLLTDILTSSPVPLVTPS